MRLYSQENVTVNLNQTILLLIVNQSDYHRIGGGDGAVSRADHGHPVPSSRLGRVHPQRLHRSCSTGAAV